MFNEGSHVLATALSFDQLDYPKNRLEIVFIDDCSTDNTYEYLQMVEAAYPHMRVSRNPRNMGKRLGIKRVVQEVTSGLVLSVDSDVIVDSQCAETAGAAHVFHRRGRRRRLRVRLQRR